MALAHARRAPASNVIFSAGRNVDIEQRFRRNAAFGDALDQRGGKFRRSAKIKILKRYEGNGDRRNA